MKKVITTSIVVMFVLMTVFLVSCQQDSLIKIDDAGGVNGSFETVEDGYPVNWVFFPNPESSNTLQVIMDKDYVKEGKQSIKLITKQSDKTVGFRSRRIPIQSGKKYRISMFVRSKGCALRVNRIVLDASGKKIQRSKIIVDTPSVLGDWKKYDEVLSVSENEVSVHLIFIIEGSGTLWCDDVKVEEMVK